MRAVHRMEDIIGSSPAGRLFYPSSVPLLSKLQWRWKSQRSFYVAARLNAGRKRNRCYRRWERSFSIREGAKFVIIFFAWTKLLGIAFFAPKFARICRVLRMIVVFTGRAKRWNKSWLGSFSTCVPYPPRWHTITRCDWNTLTDLSVIQWCSLLLYFFYMSLKCLTF